jgi:hypothetical protein
MTYTFSSTATYSRPQLIGLQIEEALVKATDISIARASQIKEAFERQELETLHIVGYDKAGVVQVELTCEVDWGKHKVFMSMGKTVVVPGRGWEGSTAFELDRALRAFNSIVKEMNLSTTWRVVYTDRIRNDQILRAAQNQKLGLVTAEPIKWPPGANVHSMVIDGLEEMSITIRVP